MSSVTDDDSKSHQERPDHLQQLLVLMFEGVDHELNLRGREDQAIEAVDKFSLGGDYDSPISYHFPANLKGCRRVPRAAGQLFPVGPILTGASHGGLLGRTKLLPHCLPT